MVPKLLLRFGAGAAALSAAALLAQTAPEAAPARPRIVGLAHVAYWVKDLAKSEAFYTGFLGFDQAYTEPGRDGGVRLVYVKIDDRQFVELFPATRRAPKDGDSLYDVAFQTDDAYGMLRYLKAHGVTGPRGRPLPERLKPSGTGCLGFFVEDPNGHTIEFVQYLADGRIERDRGRYLPADPLSSHISHAGFTVGDLPATLRFYEGLLGFTEFWRGSKNGRVLNWVNLRMPDSGDYIELMLYGTKPDLKQLHTWNHFCLEVPDVRRVAAILKTRPLPEGCASPSKINLGVNQKRQLNCYDPDGTRVEIMDVHTWNGLTPPSSSTPPPVPESM